jgi:aminoglycoside 3-N-acetyltransferase
MSSVRPPAGPGRGVIAGDTVDSVEAQPWPHTVASLRADLRALGLAAGSTVLMHSSRSSLGFVVGGPQAIVQAVLDVLGTEGTLVVPTHTSENTDPAGWQNPPVPEAWWSAIRDESPGFDPSITPASRWMGILADTARTWPGAVRSDHPQVSFAAIGARATEVTAGHRLNDALGDSSPLGVMYRLDGQVLLLGVGHDANTSLHLAEWRQQEPPLHVTGSAVRQPDGSGRWVTWTDVAEDEGDFERIGADFEAATHAARVGQVGNATARLMPQRALVDFATRWMADNRRL